MIWESDTKKLADSGIRYGMGTDTGPPGRFPGYGDHSEMQPMVDAGLTPMQVIVAATRGGAEFLGASDLGTLERSKWADLVSWTRTLSIISGIQELSGRSMWPANQYSKWSDRSRKTLRERSG